MRASNAAAGSVLALLIACTGVIGNGPNGDLAKPPAALSQSTMRRLSKVQYQQTVIDLLGVTANLQALPEDVKDPFDDDATTQPVSPALISALEQTAQQISAAFLASPQRDKIVGCVPKAPDDAECFRSFISSFGKRAYRRPLTPQEESEFLGLQSLAVEAKDFYVGVDSVLRVILQDPQFVYRVEIGKPTQSPNVARLDGYEIATRLSYFLWGSTPDDALLAAAGSGKLDHREGVEEEARRLLADPRARTRIERFHAMWLGYDRSASSPIEQAIRKESDALVDRSVFEPNRSWTELFTSTDTFVDDALAQRYGLPPPGKPTWVSYGSTGRGGILSQASFLAVAAKFADTSPTQRGKFIQERLLCSPVPPPPPNVDADAPPPSMGNVVCKYDRYAMHRVGGCAGCHERLDGVGFGLEQYDQSGVFRAAEMGLPQCTIAGQGSLPGFGAFKGPGELGKLLVKGGALDYCLAKQTFRFAMGKREAPEDDALLGRAHERFKNSQYKFTELVMAMVTDDAFYFWRQDSSPKGENQ